MSLNKTKTFLCANSESDLLLFQADILDIAKTIHCHLVESDIKGVVITIIK